MKLCFRKQTDNFLQRNNLEFGFTAMKNLIAALGLTIALVPVNSFAGKLDEFESSVTKQEREEQKQRKQKSGKHRSGKQKSRDHPRSKRSRNDDHHHHSDDSCHGFFSCLFSIFIQIHSSSSPGSESKKPDNPENSLMTFDAAYQNVEPGIFGLDTRFQLRLKRVYIEGRLTRYIETSPIDVLDVHHWKVVYPVKMGKSFTVGAGLGIYNLSGNNSSTGGSLSVPMRYQAPSSYWEFGVTPTWASINGNTISDVDFRVSYRTNKANVFVGHRTVNTGSQSLGGAYFGIGLNI